MSASATTAAAPRAWASTALALVVAGVLPFVFVGNALLVLAQPWMVDAQYALPGFPEPLIELSGDQRSDLAATGVRSISPWRGGGIDLLREARLPGGGPAFDEREVAHMSDVRGVVSGFMVAWLAGVAVLLAAGLTLRGRGSGTLMRRALGWGAVATLAGFAALGLYMLADFDGFFTAFHGVFFEGDSWRFASDDTLRSLYPDEFWGAAAGGAAGLIVAQAGVVLWRSRRGAPRLSQE